MKFNKLLLRCMLVLPLVTASEDYGDMDMGVANGNEMMEGNDGSTNMTMEMDPSPMSMEHHHGRPVLQNPSLEPQQRKYWEMYSTTSYFNSSEGNKFTLWAHALLLFTAVALMGPIALVCSTDPETQWFYVPFQTVQSLTALASLLFLALYSATAPDLYPGNAYSGWSVAMFILIIVHWVSMIVKAVTSYMSLGEYTNPNAGDYQDNPMNTDGANADEANAFVLEDFNETNRDPSLSSTKYGSDTDLPAFDAERDSVPKHLFADEGNNHRKAAAPVPALVRKLAENKIFARLNSALGKFSSLIYHTLNYPMFFTSCGYLLTGLATAFLMGKDKKVFALLAHFIKGFIFYTLGFVELARFFGVGSTRGWAWNEVYLRAIPSQSQGGFLSRLQRKLWPDHPTFEFLQSFLIFVYGSSNVFLEHLGNDDGVWTHKDLQHASIAFMFFGGGLCGMIIESGNIRRLISKAFHLKYAPRGDSTRSKVRIGWSLNPMPAFIVFWTGALMSHHQQETELATQIHVQWGTMLSLAAVIRLITIGLLYARPLSTSEEDASRPQRPFTEVLVSFCLVCGGLIFMASNRETVEGMIYRGIDQMFTLNVSVGITVLMMAYFICCLAIKGLVSTRYTTSH